jgi:exoribonuclease-2
MDHNHLTILKKIAHRSMLDHGLEPDFSGAARMEVSDLAGNFNHTFQHSLDGIHDLRSLLWCSIDNDDSLDLDQLTVGEDLPGNSERILVAIADVDALVKEGSAINEHAERNTTSVYTAAQIFPMLPEELSTNMTSLNHNEDRLALVVEMIIAPDGSLASSDVYQALVRNKAKLAYNSVAAWLEGDAPMPEAIAAVKGLAENLRLQDRVAQEIKGYRELNGALSLETIESKPVFDGELITALEVEEKNRAKDLIENFMIAANGVTARFLSAHGYPSLRRVVRTPRRWQRIVEVAQEHGTSLPDEPDSKALENFLVRQKAVDPQRFPDLSLTIIKLMGAGEYVAEPPEGEVLGHFGLAVKDYGHSTAPNRRFPDLLTQRLLKAALHSRPVPYTLDDLNVLAQHCTEAEDAANKVERQVSKSAAALLLESHIGEKFDALVTGAAEKGTWVRLLSYPIEGKLVEGYQGVDVGHHIRVQLESVDVEKGFIDFKARLKISLLFPLRVENAFLIRAAVSVSAKEITLRLDEICRQPFRPVGVKICQ